MKDILIESIDAILPQTQCRQCDFPGCKLYATAIVAGRADINQCPPGGEEGVQKLAELLGVKQKPLNTAHGVPKPKAAALIDEKDCIGCTFCIQACPVDAIVGAAKQMHTVIVAECTGCELCIAPCPIDCISMMPIQRDHSASEADITTDQINAANLARSRYQFRLQRFEREKKERAARLAQRSEVKQFTQDHKKAAVQAALKRAAMVRAQTKETF